MVNDECKKVGQMVLLVLHSSWRTLNPLQNGAAVSTVISHSITVRYYLVLSCQSLCGKLVILVGRVARWSGCRSLADGLSLPCARSMVDR